MTRVIAEPMLVLRAGRVLDPSTSFDGVADVVIEKGRVARIGPDAAHGVAEQSQVTTIDAQGLWIVPGFVDLHVHLREPGQEYKEDIQSGLGAALAGGFTTVCAMPNTNPVNDTRAVTEMMLSRARGHGARLYPIGAITKGLRGEELSEMGELREAGAVGVSDDGKCVMSAAVMRRALEYARTFDLLVSQHAEDHTMTVGAQMHEGKVSTRLGLQGWPREAEDIIVARDLILAELTGARYHVAHVSSLGAVRLLREAKSRGLRVSAEVTPHHLSLTDQALVGYDTGCKVNPPLRTEEDRMALIEALRDGTIDCVATDHAPHSSLEKDCEFQSASVGINGLETALPLMLKLVEAKLLTPMRAMEALSTAPSKLLSDVEAGSLRKDARADVAIIDPTLHWTVSASALHSRSHNTPLLHQTVAGAVTMTIVEGNVVFRRSNETQESR